MLILFLGKVSVANHLIWIEAQSPEHEELAVLGRQSMVGSSNYSYSTILSKLKNSETAHLN